MNEKIEATPTVYGQQIIELLCDHLTDSGYPYWVPPIDATSQVVKWLSVRMSKPADSVAGAVSDLIEKEFLIGYWSHKISGQAFESISVCPKAWCKWSVWSLQSMKQAQRVDHLDDQEALDWWLDWNGTDGTEVGYEFEVMDRGIFQDGTKPRENPPYQIQRRDLCEQLQNYLALLSAKPDTLGELRDEIEVELQSLQDALIEVEGFIDQHGDDCCTKPMFQSKHMAKGVAKEVEEWSIQATDCENASDDAG